MLAKQLMVEIKKVFILKNLLIWLGIILILPLIKFIVIKDAYEFTKSFEVFQETITTYIPLLFPALVIIVYLPLFWQEKKNNFITYTRPRIPFHTYLISKGLANAFFTGFVIFLLIFLPFIFCVYIEPYMGIVNYTPIDNNTVIPKFTFSQILNYGTFTYGFIYSLWVAVNAAIYSTIAFMLLLTINNSFVAFSAPFLFYHILNFITGVFGVPQFSPLSTIFPFNIVQQPLWTVFIPFMFLLIVLAALFIIFISRKERMF